ALSLVLSVFLIASLALCLYYCCFFFFFFFSSRRRHTRSKRDWSSDVCSSDLHDSLGLWPHLKQAQRVVVGTVAIIRVVPGFGVRSEERRVGKECRARRSPDE